MLYNNRMNKKQPCGFTLIELLVVVIIIAIGTSMGLPSLIRSKRQNEVDRYTQIVESGLFSLRAKLGTTKSSCELFFPSKNTFLPPWESIEFQQPNGSQEYLDERIQCCNSKEGCVGGPGYRLINREGSPEREFIEVATTEEVFQMSPPGTSSEARTLRILIRSKMWEDRNLRTNDGSSKLKTRCIEVSGSGGISRGTWDNQSQICST